MAISALHPFGLLVFGNRVPGRWRTRRRRPPPTSGPRPARGHGRRPSGRDPNRM